jgi:hypothetical protein
MVPNQQPSSVPTTCALPKVTLAAAPTLLPLPLPLPLPLLLLLLLLLSFAAGMTAALLGLSCSMVPLTE